MGERFGRLRSLGRRLFTPGESPAEGDSFETLARHLLEFNETLREADAEYPTCRMLERLGWAGQARDRRRSRGAS